MNKNTKKLLILALNFLICEGIYQVALYCEEHYFPTTPVCFSVLLTLLGVLFIIYIVLTRGYPEKPHTPDMLRSSLPYDTRVQMCEKINNNKTKAKKLLYIIISLLFVLLVDGVVMFILPTLNGGYFSALIKGLS